MARVFRGVEPWRGEWECPTCKTVVALDAGDDICAIEGVRYYSMGRPKYHRGSPVTRERIESVRCQVCHTTGTWYRERDAPSGGGKRDPVRALR